MAKIKVPKLKAPVKSLSPVQAQKIRAKAGKIMGAAGAAY